VPTRLTHEPQARASGGAGWPGNGRLVRQGKGCQP
jgi:hypothetical protein